MNTVSGRDEQKSSEMKLLWAVWLGKIECSASELSQKDEGEGTEGPFNNIGEASTPQAAASAPFDHQINDAKAPDCGQSLNPSLLFLSAPPLHFFPTAQECGSKFSAPSTSSTPVSAPLVQASCGTYNL